MRDGARIIALTGASGFVGHSLLTALLDRGYKVRALQHRTLIPHVHPNLETMYGSLGDVSCFYDFVDGVDCVIHAGGRVAARTPAEFTAINTHATSALAHIAHRKKVRRFLFISSLAARVAHLSRYAQSKYDAEQALKQVPDLSWDILRPTAIYGPNDKNSLPLMRMILKGHVFVAVQKHAIISILYIDDLIRAIIAWLETPGHIDRQCYEIAGHTSGYSWHELLAFAAIATKKPVILHRIPRSVAALVAAMLETSARFQGKTPFITRDKLNELMHPDWSVDSTAFSSATGWKPIVTPEEGFKNTLQWAKDY